MKQNLSLSLNYSEIAKAIDLFLKTEIHQSGFQQVVLGVSGGIDSALVAALACKALSPENVHGIMMPYKSSSIDSIRHAKLLADQFGFHLHEFPITEPVDAFSQLAPTITSARKGNVMARMRMITLFDFSMAHQALVLGTSNKTELLLGYGTWFGDLASSLNPIGDLYKTHIWELSEFLHIPKEIIHKEPSADLWEGQTDEQDFGFSYKIADLILYHMIDCRLKDEEIVQLGFDLELTQTIRQKVIRSQYKRKMPIICKLSTRSVGTDFLYPRDWYQQVKK